MKPQEYFMLNASLMRIRDAEHILGQIKIDNQTIAGHLLDAEQSLRKARRSILDLMGRILTGDDNA